MTPITARLGQCTYRNCCMSRRLTSGTSNVLDTAKLQMKNVVLNQWKLINILKNYVSKFTKDKAFENALNKEFLLFLQKIDPKVYGIDLLKLLSSSADTSIETKPVKKIETSNSVLPNVLNGLSINKDKEVKKLESPQWKTTSKCASLTKEAVITKTHDIVKSLKFAHSETSKRIFLEDLVHHLKKHPEAKHFAVKEGAIQILLNYQHKTNERLLLGYLNEAFALLGHAGPLPGKGIRILSIDGGGVRGILVIEMLKKLEELSGKPLYEMFDLICGVSTGAIITTYLGFKQKSLNEIADIYRNISSQIFNQSALKGTSNLVWSHSYYDTALWEKILREQWGEVLLIDTMRNSKTPKVCAVSAVVNQSRLSAYVFRNYALPCKVQSQYMGGYNHKIWECVRASAAAPTYFEEFKIGNMLHQDGGILVNNPTSVAIHEAKLLWPNKPIQCVVSFGTGRTAPNPLDLSIDPLSMQISNSSWKKKFFAIIDSATDTEGVHTMLSDLLPENVYFRFNPYLTEMLDIAEIDPKKLEQLERDAVMYLRRNEDKFQEAAHALSEKKNVSGKIVDWFNLRKQMSGI